jgi:UDPglucose--hexose-1-phosphate uridylyltransferase
MAEYRRDPVVDRWVIIAPDRAGRPCEFVELESVERAGVCPFCAGNEHLTTREIDAVREPGTAPGGPGWRTRAIGNKYPFLDALPMLGEPRPSGRNPSSLFASLPAVGPHEVLVEAPFHATRASQLSLEQTTDVLRLYRSRLRALRAEGRWRYVQIFRNVGEAAGASIEHLHSQLAALDVVPEAIAAELRGAGEYRTRHGRCVFCDLIAAELAAEVRLCEATPEFIVACPYASRFSYETAIWPRRHEAGFDALDDEELTKLAGVLRRTLGRIERLAARTSYNVLLHTAPFDAADDAYHWHLEILPRTAKAAGFEWGTGVFINAVAPEAAATRLRAIGTNE